MSKEVNFSQTAKDTLIALIERGPIRDVDLPQPSGLNELLVLGLACSGVANGEDGYQFATYSGRDAYKKMFLNEDGSVPDRLFQAMSNRILQRTAVARELLRRLNDCPLDIPDLMSRKTISIVQAEEVIALFRELLPLIKNTVPQSDL